MDVNMSETRQYYFDILLKNNPTTNKLYEAVPLRIPGGLKDLEYASVLELYAEIWRLRKWISEMGHDPYEHPEKCNHQWGGLYVDDETVDKHSVRCVKCGVSYDEVMTP